MLPLASLTILILAAMTAWVAPSRHAGIEPPNVTDARYRDIAADVAAAALERPVVDGSPERTALVLASVASFESEYAQRVDDCRTRGGSKADPAFTIFQLAGRRDLCGFRLQAARVARDIIGESLARCRYGGQDALSFYALGKCGRSFKARQRWNRAHDAWVGSVFAIGDGA